MLIKNPLLLVLIITGIILGFCANAKAEYKSVVSHLSPFDRFMQHYEDDQRFRTYTNVGATILGILALFIGFSIYLGIELNKVFLAMLLVSGAIIVLFVMSIFYVGRSAQTANPPVYLAPRNLW